MKSTEARQQGFSILEATLALALLATTTAVAAQSLGTQAWILAQSSQEQRNVLAARNHLEAMRSSPCARQLPCPVDLACTASIEPLGYNTGEPEDGTSQMRRFIRIVVNVEAARDTDPGKAIQLATVIPDPTCS